MDSSGWAWTRCTPKSWALLKRRARDGHPPGPRKKLGKTMENPRNIERFSGTIGPKRGEETNNLKIFEGSNWEELQLWHVVTTENRGKSHHVTPTWLSECFPARNSAHQHTVSHTNNLPQRNSDDLLINDWSSIFSKAGNHHANASYTIEKQVGCWIVCVYAVKMMMNFRIATAMTMIMIILNYFLFYFNGDVMSGCH